MIKVDDTILIAEFIKAVKSNEMTLEQVPEKYRTKVEEGL